MRILGSTSIPALLFTFFATGALSQEKVLDPLEGLPACPAIHEGNLLAIEPALVDVSFLRPLGSEMEEDQFIEAVRVATNLASFFENDREFLRNGGQASYNGVSRLDDLSIGQMQWHWGGGNGTLVREFMKELDRGRIELARTQELRDNLFAIHDYAYGLSSTDEATRAVQYLSKFAYQTESDLAQWLDEPQIRSHQDLLVQERMRSVLALTNTWMRDNEVDRDYFEHIFVFFANLNIHMGLENNLRTLRGVWVPQVKHFQAGLNNDRPAIANFITGWMLSCLSNTSLMEKHPDFDALLASDEVMAGGFDAFGEGDLSRGPNYHAGNAYRWREDNFIESLDQVHFDLFVYSFLAATRSKTTNEGRREPGWIQLDVLNRAGFVALRSGMTRGRAYGWDALFEQ